MKGTSVSRWIRLAGLGLAWGAFALLGGLPMPAHAANQDGLGLRMTIQGGPPADITDLEAASTAQEGAITLTWTEPGADGYNGTANSYDVRVSSVQNMENDADFDNPGVGKLLSVFSPTPVPTPGAGGSLRVEGITELNPGVTYYFAMRATDAEAPPLTNSWSRNVGLNRNATNFVYVPDLVPTVPTGLTAIPAATQVTVQWNPNPEFDIDYYRLQRASGSPMGAFVQLTTTSLTSYLDTGLVPGTSYYYRLSAVDTGPLVLESALTPWVTAYTTLILRPPMEPFGIGMQTLNPGEATLSWLPVHYFADGTAFADPVNPTIEELTNFDVWRATKVKNAPWTNLTPGGLSPSILNYVDNPPAGPPEYFYHVRAVNISSPSTRSLIRAWSPDDPDRRWAYLLAPDDETFLAIPPKLADPLQGDGSDPATGVRLWAEMKTTEGVIMKSFRLVASQGGVTEKANFTLGGLAVLHLHFNLIGNKVQPSGAGPAAVETAAGAPEDLSVFWYNGLKWVQLYGTLDASNQVLLVETQFMGGYQLRTVERAGSFAFDAGGVSNRMITPNDDGKNDNVVFTFDNPKNSSVTGRIYDLKGAVVADMVQIAPNQLKWDGKAGGQAVPGGVYIYQLQAEGQVHNGTIVVIK